LLLAGLKNRPDLFPCRTSYTVCNVPLRNYSVTPYTVTKPGFSFLCLLVHGQVTIIFVVSVGLSVCLFVCLFVYADFFSAVFDPISIKLGHM